MELVVGAVITGATVLLGRAGVPCACCWSRVAAALLPLTFVLATSGVGTFPANAYPDAIPNIAVAESPVTKILAEVAGFFIFFLLGDAVFTVDFVGGGGGGRSGSCIISRRLRRYILRHLHALHRRHRRDEVVVGRSLPADCLH